MTDTSRPQAGEPPHPAAAPGSAGDHSLRPDPSGMADPLGRPSNDPGLHSDPAGLHDPRPDLRQAAGEAADTASDLADRARERVAGLADEVHSRLGGAADAVRDRAGATYDEARERAGAMHRRHMRRLDDLTVQGLDGLRRSRTNVERFVEDNPLLVGVVGVAAGLLLGALLPRTRQEDRNIGPWADEVRDQGLRYAREMTHRGREFVHTALDPDNLNAAARKVAEEEDTPPPPEGERRRHTL